MEAIACRSIEQAQEDNVCELHTRLTRWLMELRATKCFDSYDQRRKYLNVEKLKGLIEKVEFAIEQGKPDKVNVYIVERLGIKYSSI